VPLQGHWDRVNTPLRKTTSRERRIVWAFGALLAVAAIVAGVVFVANGSSSPTVGPGCLRIEVGSTMGGGATTICGKAARNFCGSSAAHAEQGFLAKCRDAGYAVTPE
jgi:predicted membrane-bound mannosyltransferase